MSFILIILVQFMLMAHGQKDLNARDVFDGIYEFDMEFETGLVSFMYREMRVYLCPSQDKIFMSVTDYKPRNGFDEFTIGVAVFNNNVMPIIKEQHVQFNLETTDAIIIGDMHKFLDANYTLKFESNTDKDSEAKLTFIYEFFDADEIIKNQYNLKRVKDSKNNALLIKQDEKSFKCWIPYNEESIENIHKEGKSIWKSNQVIGLNVYDMDIFNEKGNNKGCWAWVNQNGVSIEADNLGTAGGMNHNYKYKLDGNLMIVDWIDDGTWITVETRNCHWGTSIFMIIEANKAVVTFTCSDEITGSQMIMYRQPVSKNLKCPLLKKRNAKKKKNDKTEL